MGSQEKSASVTVDQQDRVSVSYLSMGTGPSSEPPRQTDSIPQSSPRIRIEKVTAPELRYRLLEEFGRVRLCECGPRCRGDETQREIETFPEIQKDASTFRAIAAHLDLGGTKIVSDEQKLAIYREYAQLRSVNLELLVTKYKFITVGNAFRTRGLIDPQGQITILNREPKSIGSCPVCLASSTRIDTPSGAVPVKDLKVGMLVWTLDSKGQKVAVPILKTSAVPVPPAHRMMHLVMKDRRELWASSGHPTIDGHTVGELQQTSIYDSAVVAYSEVVPYDDTKTYDLLPAGNTGFYWANGILLASTLR
ncbi:MAG TPA: Hint domain-containing protein [Terriglobales bacterium]|nr:Hint domain-containing protein [Terriglobales bacterium]